MDRPRRLLLGCLFAVGLAVPAFAANPYLAVPALDLTALMPPPPAKGSDAAKADMAAVLLAQSRASDARKAQALADSEETIYVVYGALLGDRFAVANTPRTATLFARIGDTEDDALGVAKPYFGRVRPWLADPDVKAIARPSNSGSYPSGHSTRVTIYAIIMSMMVPEKKDAIWARANDYMQSRIIGGMHFPTDVLAGQRSGTALAALLLQDPAFTADLAAAKIETRAALGL